MDIAFNFGVQRFSSNAFDDKKYDSSAIKSRQRKKIENTEVYGNYRKDKEQNMQSAKYKLYSRLVCLCHPLVTVKLRVKFLLKGKRRANG